MLRLETGGPRQLFMEIGRDQADRIELRVRVLQGGARRPAVVVEDQDIFEHGVALVDSIPVDVRLHDLLHLGPRQQGRGSPVVGTADQDFACPDRIPLPETPVAPLLALGRQLEGGVKVGHHPDRPARRVGGRAGRSVCQHLRRRHLLVAGAERTDIARRDCLPGGLGEGVRPAGALGCHGHPAAGDQILT